MSVYLNSIVKDRDDGKVFFSLKSIFLFEMKDILKDIIKYAIVFFKNTCGPLFTQPTQPKSLFCHNKNLSYLFVSLKTKLLKPINSQLNFSQLNSSRQYFYLAIIPASQTHLEQAPRRLVGDAGHDAQSRKSTCVHQRRRQAYQTSASNPASKQVGLHLNCLCASDRANPIIRKYVPRILHRQGRPCIATYSVTWFKDCTTFKHVTVTLIHPVQGMGRPEFLKFSSALRR